MCKVLTLLLFFPFFFWCSCSSCRRHVFFHRKTDVGNQWSGFLPPKPGPLVSCRLSTGTGAAGGTFFSIGKRMRETSGPHVCCGSPDYWFSVGSQRAPEPPAARFFPSENGCRKQVVRISAVEARTTGFLRALNGHRVYALPTPSLQNDST